MAHVDLGDAVELLVGIADVVEPVDEPCVALRPGVLHGEVLLCGQQILRIQHVEHWEEAVATHQREIALRVVDELRQLAHLL